MSKAGNTSHTSTTRTQARNLLFNWGGFGSTLLVMFFLSPYIVGKLTAVEYGIWSLLNVMTGYMGLFDLGVRASVGRHVALYLGKGDHEGVDETIRAGLGFFSLAGLLILVLSIVLGLFFPQVFKSVPPQHYITVRLLLPLMVVSIWLTAIGSIFSSVLSAHERFDIARGVDLVVLLVRTVGTVWVLHIGWGLFGMTGVIILGGFFAAAGNRICASRLYAQMRAWPFLYTRKRFKELTSYGFGAFLTSASAKIIGQTDLVVAGAAVSVAAVREYSVGAMIVFYSGTFLMQIVRTFFPTMQKAVSRGDMSTAAWVYGRQVRLSIIVGSCVLVGLAAFSRPFIRLWMFQDGFAMESVYVSSIVMSILALAKLPLLYTKAAESLLMAMGHIRFTSTITVIEACLNFFISLMFVLVLGWGLPGIAAGTLCACLLVSSFIVPLSACAKLGLKPSSFFKGTLLPLLCVCTGFGAVCLGVQKIIFPDTWIAFFLDVFLCVLLYVILAVPLLLPADYRNSGLAFVRQKVLSLGGN